MNNIEQQKKEWLAEAHSSLEDILNANDGLTSEGLIECLKSKYINQYVKCEKIFQEYIDKKAEVIELKTQLEDAEKKFNEEMNTTIDNYERELNKAHEQIEGLKKQIK
tara:strand:+ start:133 stop:456 length:324 start_codon:yes stop_codon:yes gene_type:complete